MDIINALDSAVWYNGYYDIINEIKSYIMGYKTESKYNVVLFPHDILDKYDNDHFVRVIWLMMVEMFGSCGTSPRYGWINGESKYKAIDFLNNISKTSQEYEREGI